MFLLKKIVSPLFFPLPLCVLLLIFGLFLLWFTRRQRAGKIITTLGAALLVLLSYGPVPNFLLRRLEQQYPPLSTTASVEAPLDERLSNVRWIVVLGGGHTSDPKIPVAGNLSHSSLYRLVEGIELHRRIPGSRLVLSGSAIWRANSDAKAMALVAEALGIERQNIVLEEESNDTEDQAVFIKRVVGEDSFVLVTSAWHMPRAMGLFARQGMNPVPAPTDYRVIEGQLTPRDYYPNAGHLINTELAIYETLGRTWAKMRGRL